MRKRIVLVTCLMAISLMCVGFTKENVGDTVAAPKGSEAVAKVSPKDKEAEKLAQIEMMEYELSDELFEAITIFPMLTTELVDNEDFGWIVDNYLVYRDSDESKYAGMKYIHGKDKSPVDIDFIGAKKGDKIEYEGISRSDLAKAIKGFYGKKITVPNGELIGGTCINAKGKVLEWGNTYYVSYEGVYSEFKLDRSYIEYGDLVVEGRWLYSYCATEDDEATETPVRIIFTPNEESMYGWSLVSYETNYKWTLEDITAEENRIRKAVNSGDAVKVELARGTDGSDFARWFCYEDGELVFAYYFNSKSGAPDSRYYFKDGVMIEWIEGNGNNDKNRRRMYVTDIPIDEYWNDNEVMVRDEAAEYAK